MIFVVLPETTNIDELALFFILQGHATLTTLQSSSQRVQTQVLEQCDCAVPPPGQPVRWVDPSEDFEVIEVAFPKAREDGEVIVD